MTKLATLFVALLVVGTYVSATPAQPETLTLAAPSASITRTQESKASRSRSAVIAPPLNAPAKPEPVGVHGVKAVPKPKPKKKPKPKATSEKQGSSSKKVYRGTGKCASIGVKSNAAALCSAVLANFGPMTVGGFRAGAGEHGQGRAVDIMVTGSKGDAIAEFVLANAGQYNVEYIIWKQRYREPGGSWDMMEDRGSITQNHYDHVHVTVN